jgi:hypothetical protein
MNNIRYETSGAFRNKKREYLKQKINEFLSSYFLSQNLKIKIYKTIHLPVVLYGCETSSFTLREGHRLRASENRVLRRYFNLKGRG